MLLFLSGMMLAAAQPRPTGAMPVVDPNAFQPATCPATSRDLASRRGKARAEPKKLNRLPPADAYFAVYRRIGGCEAPMLIKYGVGGN